MRARRNGRRASVLAGGGVEADAGGEGPTAVSADGRYVVFGSTSTNLVAQDIGGNPELFLRDRLNETTSLVSLATDDTPADAGGTACSVTPDGQYVVFESVSDNLVPGTTPGVSGVFVRDLVAGTTTLASVAGDGTPLPADSECSPQAISDDGRFVVFASWDLDAKAWMVYLRDLQGDTTTLLNVAPDASTILGSTFYAFPLPAISADGSHVAFASDASGLTIDTDDNGVADIFERDLLAGATSMASLTSTGQLGTGPSGYPAISGDGRYIAFASAASDLVPTDTNHVQDLFVRDTQALTTERVNVSTAKVQSNWFTDGPVGISEDGRFVAFSSRASLTVTGSVRGSENVFLHDLATGVTTLMSVASNGDFSCDDNVCGNLPAISADGAYVAFMSSVTNLVPEDTNAFPDVFLRATSAPMIQPNAEIALEAAGPYKGASVANTTGKHQAAAIAIARRHAHIFFVKVENDSNVVSGFRVSGAGSRPGFGVRYVYGGENVTAGVVAGKFILRRLQPGGSATLRLRIGVRRSAGRHITRAWVVHVVARLDHTRADAVRAIVTVR
jgi:Tol biopolymer transport system component